MAHTIACDNSSGPASYATFDGVSIHDTQATGFSANDAGNLYTNLVLRRMEVYNTGTETGECFYLGCNQDKCQVKDSLVELNYCHDTKDAQSGYGSGVQLKTGSYSTLTDAHIRLAAHHHSS
jgi:hypothetical protein